MTKNRIFLLLLLPLLGGLLITGLRLSGRAGSVVYGDPQPLGDGTVRSFVTHDAEGQPLTVGVSMTAAALQNLPDRPPQVGPAHEVVLLLPKRSRDLPFDHISVDWNPMGHEPDGMYDAPHFDIHFYMMTDAERNTIDPAASDFEEKASRHPEAAFLPANHVPAPDAVPRMGNHWVDADAPEMNGQPFSMTFLFGSWDGRVTFLEPMITKASLEDVREREGQMMRAAIPQPDSVATPGYYPTAYSVQYDDREETYAVVLEGLTRR